MDPEIAKNVGCRESKRVFADHGGYPHDISASEHNAWLLKIDSADRAAAEAALADWYHHAGDFDVAETNRLALTLRAWEAELLAYFDEPLTNGPTEGTNRIIKAVKRHGFGYTNADNYRLRVLYRCA